MPPWCRNVIAVARICGSESVVVAVDEPLRAEAERLGGAVAEAGAKGQLLLLPPGALSGLSSRLRDDPNPKTWVRVCSCCAAVAHVLICGRVVGATVSLTATAF
jgi:hypothetical protein